jgi:hypothetical protein
MVQLWVPSDTASSTAWIVTTTPVFQFVPSSTAWTGDGRHCASSLEFKSIETGLVGVCDKVMVKVVEPVGSLIVVEPGALTRIEAARAEDGSAVREARNETTAAAKQGTTRERRGISSSGSRKS